MVKAGIPLRLNDSLSLLNFVTLDFVLALCFTAEQPIKMLSFRQTLSDKCRHSPTAQCCPMDDCLLCSGLYFIYIKISFICSIYLLAYGEKSVFSIKDHSISQRDVKYFVCYVIK